MQIITIYALVDPLHAVSAIRWSDNRRKTAITTAIAWATSRLPARGCRHLPEAPILVILETSERKKVWCASSGLGASAISETKWIKRFRRTVINIRTRANSTAAWDALVNPPLPWETPLPWDAN
jgi:hypothetical protein